MPAEKPEPISVPTESRQRRCPVCDSVERIVHRRVAAMPCNDQWHYQNVAAYSSLLPVPLEKFATVKEYAPGKFSVYVGEHHVEDGTQIRIQHIARVLNQRFEMLASLPVGRQLEDINTPEFAKLAMDLAKTGEMLKGPARNIMEQIKSGMDAASLPVGESRRLKIICLCGSYVACCLCRCNVKADKTCAYNCACHDKLPSVPAEIARGGTCCCLNGNTSRCPIHQPNYRASSDTRSEMAASPTEGAHNSSHGVASVETVGQSDRRTSSERGKVEELARLLQQEFEKPLPEYATFEERTLLAKFRRLAEAVLTRTQEKP